MTDLFTHQPPQQPRQRSSGHPRFRVGDRVRSISEWQDGKTPLIPTGEVTRVDSFGLGQIIKVGSDPWFYVAGIFEMEDPALG